MPNSETRFAVLLFTDIVDSTELKARHGVPAYSEALRTHNGHFERIARECLNTRTLQSRGDGYFAEAGSVAGAVRFALLFEEAMREGPWSEVRLTARVGISAGEVGALDTEDGAWIVAPAADLAARVTDLAVGGQILLTRFPFDEARHFIREHPPVDGKTMPALCWLAHGPYRMKGRDEPMDIFEVGAEGLAPLAAPADTEKAKRAIHPGEEETLGWRPAVGLEIPGRTGWQLIERLGAGGFGEVWIGEHAKLHQRRAFKFCFDDERLRALKREVTLVRLLRSALGERDDIVHIHELKLEAPPFYLESDLAPYGNLLQWAERQGGLANIPLAQRIALVAHTATALAAAHSAGVLHKDIKPTNILIFDGPGGEPRPRLVDFGIGTLADPAVLGEHGVTAAGFTRTKVEHSTGTPTYSPPEYLAGKPYTIQGDIYGLGVLLYQLVTIKPFDPLAPGWERDISDPLLREDIALCVDGDPARRLPSAADLADRLLRLEERRAEIEEKERLTLEAAARAEAEAAATAARLRATRLRKLTAAFAILAVLAITGGVLAWMKRQEAAAALGEVARKKTEVDRKNDEQRTMLIEAARADRSIAEEELRTGKEQEAFVHLARACGYDPRSTFAAEKAAAALNGWRHPLPVTVFVGHKNAVYSLHVSHDGARVVTASFDKTARVWEAATGKSIATLAGHENLVWSAQFSPDGTRIVTTSPDATARVWDAGAGKLITTLEGHLGFVSSAQFSPDGARVVTASDDKTACVWDAATGKPIAALEGHADRVSSAQFSPDGARVVTASDDKTARVWDAATGKPIATLEGHADRVNSAQFSPDGARIATASRDNTARIWDAAGGKAIITLEGHANHVNSAEFSPDGTRIVTTSDDRTARVWVAASGEPVATLVGHGDFVYRAQFSSNGAFILTPSRDKTARVWAAAPDNNTITLAGHQGLVSSAQFSRDSARIVTASEDKTARIWDAATGKLIATLAGHLSSVRSAQFSPDGAFVATASEDMTARIWGAATGKPVVTLKGHAAGVSAARFSRDGVRIVTASDDKTARIWDAATGKPIATLEGHAAPVRSAQFSPDGTRIVTVSRDNTARVCDAATGEPIATAEGFAKDVRSAEFSPDGTRIVTCPVGFDARVWEAATGKLVTTLKAPSSRVSSAEFSPDGTRIVTTSPDANARVWDAGTGRLTATLKGHTAAVISAQFSADGVRIVTASEDKTTRVWDATTGTLIATLDSYAAPSGAAQFSPDGTHIVATSRDKTVRVWTLLPSSAGPPPEWFPDFLRYVAQMRLNEDGEPETLKPADWLALRERMRGVRRASTGKDTPYLRILRRWVPE